jgi:DNA repair exonuclease SbcCD ATPase subunit
MSASSQPLTTPITDSAAAPAASKDSEPAALSADARTRGTYLQNIIKTGVATPYKTMEDSRRFNFEFLRTQKSPLFDTLAKAESLEEFFRLATSYSTDTNISDGDFALFMKYIAVQALDLPYNERNTRVESLFKDFDSKNNSAKGAFALAYRQHAIFDLEKTMEKEVSDELKKTDGTYKAAMESAAKEHKQQLDAAQLATTSLTTRNQELSEKLSDQSKKLSAAQQEVASLKEQLEKKHNQHTAAESVNIDLGNRLAAARMQVDGLTNQLATFSQNYTTATANGSRISEFSARNRSLSSEKAALERRVADLVNQIESLNAIVQEKTATTNNSTQKAPASPSKSSGRYSPRFVSNPHTGNEVHIGINYLPKGGETASGAQDVRPMARKGYRN